MPDKSANPSTTNVNSITKTGFYSIGVPANYTNLGESSLGILVVLASSVYIAQFYLCTTSNMWTRMSVNGGQSWTDWKAR